MLQKYATGNRQNVLDLIVSDDTLYTTIRGTSPRERATGVFNFAAPIIPVHIRFADMFAAMSHTLLAG